MNKVLMVGYLLLGAAFLYLVYKIVGAVQDGATSAGDAITEAWQETKDGVASVFDGTKEYLTGGGDDPFDDNVARSIAVDNPIAQWVSRLFHSKAEDEVNTIYAPNRNGLPPGVDKKGGVNLTNPRKDNSPTFASDVFNPQDPKGIAPTNPGPGPTTTSGRITKRSINRGNASRANGDVTFSGSSNPTPPVNQTNEDPNARSGAFDGAIPGY